MVKALWYILVNVNVASRGGIKKSLKSHQVHYVFCIQVSWFTMDTWHLRILGFPELKKALVDDAVRLCTHIQYGSAGLSHVVKFECLITPFDCAGTVEFIVDDKSTKHFFLEMNTRLQVPIYAS